MKKSLSMYRYYKGEPTNLCDGIEQNTAFMFWGYESGFEAVFNRGDFSPGGWETPTMTELTKNELAAAMGAHPIDKIELFKVWVYNLLMEYLPDKHEKWRDELLFFNNLYWAITFKSM